MNTSPLKRVALFTSKKTPYWIGKKRSQETKDKISKTKKGCIPWNKGNHVCCNTGKTHFKKGEISGENHPHWKGGIVKHNLGYILIWSENHPFAVRGYVLEHRLVMEKYLGRFLTKEEVVHHKNKIVSDNRIENLELFSSNGVHLSVELTGTKRPNYGKS